MVYSKAELKSNVDRAQDNGHVDFKWLINLSSVSGAELARYMW